MFVLLLHYYSAHPTPAYAEIARHLRDRSHTVWIGQPTEDGHFVFLDGSKEVGRVAGPLRGRLAALPFMLRLRRRVQALRPDVVQITPSPWSWIVACWNAAPMVFINDIRTAGSGVGEGMRARLLDLSAWLSWRIGSFFIFDATVFLNETGARWLFGPRWSRHAHLVPLGVDESFLSSTTHPAPLADGAPVQFVYLGTISLERHLDRVLQAVRSAAKRTPRFHLTLIGPDDGAGSRDVIREYIERHDIAETAGLMPAAPYGQIPAVLGNFHVALNYVPATRVQRRQTFLKLLECRALGMPQITTRTGPNAEVIRDGENGLLVADDPEAYAEAMVRLIDDRPLLAKLTEAARADRAGLSWRDVATQYESMYVDLLRTRQHRAAAEASH